MVPHDGRWRRPRESRGRLGLAHSGRVAGSRESDDSPNGAGLVLRLRLQTWVALATANGQAHERASDERRRNGERGGVGTPHSRGAYVTALVGQRERAELNCLALVAGFAARRLGDSAAWRPVGSPAQWQKPGKWGCVGTRDRTTKPSRGWRWVVVRKLRLVLAATVAARNKVTKKIRAYWLGRTPPPPVAQLAQDATISRY